MRHTFVSDNASGVHPEILAALVAANEGHAHGYGDDPWTRRLEARVRDVFGEDATVYPVFGGTGANVLALRALTRRVDAVVCAASSHLWTDETGAPEATAGIKLLPQPSADGRLDVALLADVPGVDGDHRVRPSVLSLTQSTECGTVYAPDRLRALVDAAHARGWRVHLDGARLYNAAAGLGVSLRALTTDVGVDVVSLGGTKNGCLGAEALVVLRPGVAEDVGLHRKQITQLPSKMRFVAAQLDALLDAERWRRLARAANAGARRLEAGLRVHGYAPRWPVEANAVFVGLSTPAIAALALRYTFEVWDPPTGLVRFVCGWDITDAAVDALVADIAATG